MKRILVAGIGNLFKGDDAFGVEVIRMLATRFSEPHVEVVDFGIRGIDLAFALLDGGHDLVILVDAVERGGAPGTVYLIDPDLESLRTAGAEPHGMHPAQVLAYVRALGGTIGPLRLVGCEPAEIGTDEELKMGLSPPVQAAVAQAAHVVEQLVREALCTS